MGLLMLVVLIVALVVGFQWLSTVLLSLTTTLTLLQTQLTSVRESVDTIETPERLEAAVHKLVDKKQLIAVSSDHWLLATLYEAKRLAHAMNLDKERDTNPLISTQELKTKYLTALLPDLKCKHLSSPQEVSALSKRVVFLASVFSELLSEHEPLLVEVALVHCLHEWISQQHSTCSSLDDVEAFEAFFRTELQGERAEKWFNCQLIIDTVDLLVLSRHFYKQRITNQILRDYISQCIVGSGGDEDDLMGEILVRLVMKENKVASAAWTAWLGEEIATIGFVRRNNSEPSSLAMLGRRVINPTHFDPRKRAYFPLETAFNGIGSNSFGDLSGVINLKPTASDDDAMRCGFIYHGGELLTAEDLAIKETEATDDGYEVVDEANTNSHLHTD